MHLSRHIHFILSLVLAGNLLQGQAVRTLQLNEAVRLALTNNKSLALASFEIERAKSLLRWSGRLDNPELELSGGQDSLGLNEGEHSLEIAFTQKYPFTSRLRDEKNLRRTQVLLAEAELAERQRQLASEVAETVIQLVSSQRHNLHQREHAKLQISIADLLRTLAQRGEASKLDLAQAELQVRHIKQKGLIFEARLHRHRLHLNQVLGLEPKSRITVSYQLNIPREISEQRVPISDILPRRPDHVLALSNIDASKMSLELEKAKRWEDVTVRVFLEKERSTDEPIGLESNTFAGIGISIPLPLRQKNEGGIEQAEIESRAARQASETLRFNIQAEYESAYGQRLDAWRIAFDANNEILQLAKKSYDDFRMAYLDGQVSLLQVQRAQEQLIELKSDALEATVQYHQAEIHLRKVTGDFPIQEAANKPANKQ
jgi:cobalt-zinc-cadmium efflux system outer membrane protein